MADPIEDARDKNLSSMARLADAAVTRYKKDGIEFEMPSLLDSIKAHQLLQSLAPTAGRSTVTYAEVVS